jgi:hypothetical protein
MIVPFDFKCSAKNQQVTHQQSFRMRGRWTEHIKRFYIFFLSKAKDVYISSIYGSEDERLDASQ